MTRFLSASLYSAPFFIFIFLLSVSCASTGKRSLYYQVKIQRGDSLAEIAHKYDTTWQRILRDNSLKSPQEIHPGKVILVRPGPGGYIAGTDSMPREARPSEKKQGFWSRLFGGKRSTGRSGGLLYGNRSAGTGDLLWPVNGPVTSEFGYRGFSRHEGIDIDGRTGDQIKAAARGVVKFAGHRGSYGRLVILQHGDFRTRYAHLHRIGVRKGQTIEQGQYIGQLGATGNASGSHLHFEVRDNSNVAIDPLPLLGSRQDLYSSK